MLYWWPIAKHVSAFLAAKPEFAAPWSIYPGSKGSAKSYPCIEVQWDEEAGVSIHKANQGNLTLWLDIWVRSDQVTPDEVYQQQYEAQLAILNSLEEWSDLLLEEVGLAVKIDCPGIASQGTITRPSFGCRMIITMEWRK
ncbi:Hypothetical protein LUCI_0781 [Lucifera butyrica]|uniref:Uncharacterized protein n=1 Tax=Lucifera butyrica TaxID=1351585 RepID=A0A498R2F1_9FIRM|nr:hypothetical protein [Lucifera butyrica]VBB05571.1 Hypothetical protein LUCI_0781 [Lucifera butyrica]